MNESEQQSPSPMQNGLQPDFIEKSAFDDDNDDMDDETVSDFYQQRSQAASSKNDGISASTQDIEEQKQTVPSAESTVNEKKRTLSDVMEEKAGSQKTTQDTSDSGSANQKQQEEDLSPEEAQRRTDELIQKMLQEDQAAAGDAPDHDEEDEYYDEETLPDENTQMEVIRRMRQNEVVDEAQNTLALLESLKRQQQEQLESSPSPQSTPDKQKPGTTINQNAQVSPIPTFQQDNVSSANQQQQIRVQPAHETSPEQAQNEPAPKKLGFFGKLFGGNKAKKSQQNQPKPSQPKPAQPQRQQVQFADDNDQDFDAQMAAAIAASLNQDNQHPAVVVNPANQNPQAAAAATLVPRQLGSDEQEAETEELMLLIAQNESAREEKERIEKERALSKATNSQNWAKKVYDDIIFDNSAICQIHPNLQKVQVHQITTDMKVSDLFYESIKIDGEYFLEDPDSAINSSSQAAQANIASGSQQIPTKKVGKVDQWIKKADNFLNEIGI